MNYVHYFDVAALLLNSMLILNIYSRKTYHTKTSHIYKLMLWLNFICCCFDISSAYLIPHFKEYPLWINYIVNAGYLTSHNITMILFINYVICLVRKDDSSAIEGIVLKAVAVYEVLAICSSPFTKFVFYFDETGYRHGPLMITLYLLAFIIFFYALYLFINYKRMLTTYQTITYILFLTFVFGGVLFQVFFPEYLVESLCVAIAFLMMNLALDNPETYFYRNTYSFNQSAFNDHFDRKVKAKKKFSILAFTYDDLAMFKKKYGEDFYNEIYDDTLRICQKYYRQKDFFVLDCNGFAIEIDNDSLQREANILSGCLAREVRLDERVVSLVPHFCYLEYSEAYTSVADVYDAICSMLFDVYRNTGEKLITDCEDALAAKQREALIVHRLHEAINSDGFDVYYQPIFDRVQNRFVSAEALVRLKQQSGDYIGPDEFIPVAEENGMILKIGEIVFQKVCLFLQHCGIEKLGIDYVEVNLSRMQLLNDIAASHLVRIAKKYGISPSNINFEITETFGIDEGDRGNISKNIDYLREKGFSFSLDDYGSGYSNLSFLAKTPFNIVKVDRDILWNAMKTDRYKTILENFIALVHGLGSVCVAEGVENEEMIELLTSYNCDHFQGYFYSRPLPETEFYNFIMANK